MHRANANAARCGFTLIELIVALALLALLMTGVYTTIRTSTQAAASGEALIDRTNRLRVTQELLRRQLSQALALPLRLVRGTNEAVFLEGERDMLTWVSVMPGYLGRGGPYVQQIALERDARSQDLVFRHAMLHDMDADRPFDDQKRPPVVLLEDVRSLRIEYRSYDDSGRLGDWQDRWNKPFQLPQLVRIKVEFERDSRQAWPDLVIPLLVDPGAGAINQAPNFGPRM